MNLLEILALSFFSLVGGLLVPPKYRKMLLLIGSLVAVYGMQPASAINHLDFWLPTAAVGLTLVTWAITQASVAGDRRAFWFGSALILITVLAWALLSTNIAQTHTLLIHRSPALWLVAVVMIALLVLVVLLQRLPDKRILISCLSALILVIFVILKTDVFLLWSSLLLRWGSGQDTSLASVLDIRWLGFSYLAFRLLHVLRDHQMGKLPMCGLVEFTVYALFFSTYTAGPIDRLPRFLSDLPPATLALPANQATLPNIQSPASPRPHLNLPPETVFDGSKRIIWGIFKKFAVADTLALVALNGQNTGQITRPLWLWLLLYAYALRIYFDFSGYTDIAIGMGNLWGIHFPENFLAPYLKTNLTQFWNSWHITLAQWLRAYFFNPLTRWLRSGRLKSSTTLVIFIGQMSTMVLIGLWHGVTWNFAIWGAWHGLGLFIHNRYNDWWRSQDFAWANRSPLKQLLKGASWLLTFQYICLGWVWFALPDIGQAWGVFHRLFGV